MCYGPVCLSVKFNKRIFEKEEDEECYSTNPYLERPPA